MAPSLNVPSHRHEDHWVRYSAVPMPSSNIPYLGTLRKVLQPLPNEVNWRYIVSHLERYFRINASPLLGGSDPEFCQNLLNLYWIARVALDFNVPPYNDADPFAFPPLHGSFWPKKWYDFGRFQVKDGADGLCIIVKAWAEIVHGMEGYDGFTYCLLREFRHLSNVSASIIRSFHALRKCQ